MLPAAVVVPARAATTPPPAGYRILPHREQLNPAVDVAVLLHCSDGFDRNVLLEIRAL